MKHKIFLGFIAFEVIILLLLYISGRVVLRERQGELIGNKHIAHSLMLTDVALWTEARYTRNPSQADLFSPFQDFPSSIDHFPAGSILAPERRADFGNP